MALNLWVKRVQVGHQEGRKWILFRIIRRVLLTLQAPKRPDYVGLCLNRVVRVFRSSRMHQIVWV